MSTEELLQKLVLAHDDRKAAQKIIHEHPSFRREILDFQNQALTVWHRANKRYSDKEFEFGIPYTFVETPKLYAIDALVVSKKYFPRDEKTYMQLAEFFTVFYLIVHLFDDHVEHRDKFYSKFDFRSNSNVDTQQGAAPFSFMLLSFEILSDILADIAPLSYEKRLRLMKNVTEKLAFQTRYFAAERHTNLNAQDVLDIKLRQVSGITLSILADVLEALGVADEETETLRSGLLYLGSLTQITDDIRDLTVDVTLRNANLVVSCMRNGDLPHAAMRVAEIYTGEVKRAEEYLSKIYSTEQLEILLSLPLYPFFVNKATLSVAREES